MTEWFSLNRKWPSEDEYILWYIPYLNRKNQFLIAKYVTRKFRDDSNIIVVVTPDGDLSEIHLTNHKLFWCRLPEVITEAPTS